MQKISLSIRLREKMIDGESITKTYGSKTLGKLSQSEYALYSYEVNGCLLHMK
jgi:hypothetical protein